MIDVLDALETRRAGLGDLDALLADVRAGFASYADFAPSGWRPPPVPHDRERTVELLCDAQTWALLALVARRPVGHVAFLPAREHAPDDPRQWQQRPQIPGLAHLWQLFVLPEWWGQGVAAVLHDAAVAEMHARGFEQARLYTPSRHARARHFYERRGWAAAGEQYNDQLQLMLTEYQLPIAARLSSA